VKKKIICGVKKLASIVSGGKDSNGIDNTSNAKLEVQTHKLYCTFSI
jgi:hypothetical protein